MHVCHVISILFNYGLRRNFRYSFIGNESHELLIRITCARFYSLTAQWYVTATNATVGYIDSDNITSHSLWFQARYASCESGYRAGTHMTMLITARYSHVNSIRYILHILCQFIVMRSHVTILLSRLSKLLSLAMLDIWGTTHDWQSILICSH